MRPAARRTPLASYITTKATVAARANRGESSPCSKAIAAAVPVTRAEWLDGIPPVSINTAGRQRRCHTSSIKSLESWARPQAASPQARGPLLSWASTAGWLIGPER